MALGYWTEKEIKTLIRLNGDSQYFWMKEKTFGNKIVVSGNYRKYTMLAKEKVGVITNEVEFGFMNL